MRTIQGNLVAKLVTASHFPAANNAAIVTIAAAADQCWCIRRITFSYSQAQTGGRLTVVAGSTTLLDIDLDSTVTRNGKLDYSSDNVLTNNTVNEIVTVTLAAGGASVVGKLTVQYQ